MKLIGSTKSAQSVEFKEGTDFSYPSVTLCLELSQMYCGSLLLPTTDEDLVRDSRQPSLRLARTVLTFYLI
jgi:hypothetical protein